DVMGALPEALARRGHEVIVFLPHYRDLVLAEPPRERGRISVPFGARPEPGMVLEAALAGRQARPLPTRHSGGAPPLAPPPPRPLGAAPLLRPPRHLRRSARPPRLPRQRRALPLLLARVPRGHAHDRRGVGRAPRQRPPDRDGAVPDAHAVPRRYRLRAHGIA